MKQWEKAPRSQLQSLGTAAQSFHPPKLADYSAENWWVTSIMAARERQTHGGLTAFLVILPAWGKEVNGLFETSSPEVGLQEALLLQPLAWHESQDLVQCNTALLPYTVRLKLLVSSLPPPSCFSAALPPGEWSCGQDENQAGALLAGLWT